MPLAAYALQGVHRYGPHPVGCTRASSPPSVARAGHDAKKRMPATKASDPHHGYLDLLPEAS